MHGTTHKVKGKIRGTMWRALGLSTVLLVGCHSPAKNFAKLDVADPALPSGWVQFRHEPGGYAFQAPSTWVVDSQTEALQAMARTKSDLNLWLRIADLEAGRKGDLVTFTITRLALPGDEELRITNLDEYGKKALIGMRRNMPDARHERLTLPIGAAEHVWGTMEKVHIDGRRERLTSHMVVFATALRPFLVVYGYPSTKEATYRPTFDAMVRTLRLFLPKPNGMVTIPASARLPEPTMPAFSGSVNAQAMPPTASSPPPYPDPNANRPQSGPPAEPPSSEPPPYDPGNIPTEAPAGDTGPPAEPPTEGADPGEGGIGGGERG